LYLSTLQASPQHPALPSFPTRRSSDLNGHRKFPLTKRFLTPASIATEDLNWPNGSRRSRNSVSLTLLEQFAWCSRTAPIGSGKRDRKSTRLNSSHRTISYAVFCLKKKK